MEVVAFEYFEYQTLSMFRACYPSLVWDCTVGFSAQTDETLRNIAIALGYQQRLVEGRGSCASLPQFSPTEQSDILYGKAIASLRRTLESDALVAAPIIVLECLLLIVLESLRGNSRDLLLHLQSAVRITTQAAQYGTIAQRDELFDITALLQHACISAWLFCTSPAYSGDYALILQSIDFQQLSNLEFTYRQEASSFEIHSIITKVIYVIRQLMHPHAKPQHREPLFNDLFQLRAKARHIESVLILQHAQSPYRNFLEVKLIMIQIFLSATLTHPNDLAAEDKGFSRVLDLLQDSLVDLILQRRRNLDSTVPRPLCIGTGVIQVVETIVRISKNPQLKSRALDLLKICPPQEGLWSTKHFIRAYDLPSAIEVEQEVQQRPTLAIGATDKLATAEDCVALAERMLEDLHL